MSTDTGLSLEMIVMLDLEPEPPCESPHNYVEECSVSVAYRLSACYLSPLSVCANSVEDPDTGAAARAARGTKCKHCKRPARECWSWWPV